MEKMFKPTRVKPYTIKKIHLLTHSSQKLKNQTLLLHLPQFNKSSIGGQVEAIEIYNSFPQYFDGLRTINMGWKWNELVRLHILFQAIQTIATMSLQFKHSLKFLITKTAF
jgi:hypothetical protein